MSGEVGWREEGREKWGGEQVRERRGRDKLGGGKRETWAEKVGGGGECERDVGEGGREKVRVKNRRGEI
jgi:hypothetical protein